MNINVSHNLDDFVHVACLAIAVAITVAIIIYFASFSRPKLIALPIFTEPYSFHHVQLAEKRIKWEQ